MIALYRGFTVVLLALCFLAACTAPVKPETPTQQVLAAYSAYTLAVNTLASLVETGTVSPTEALKYQKHLFEVRVALDNARVLLADGLPETDADALQLMRNAILVLNRVSAELAARGGAS